MGTLSLPANEFNCSIRKKASGFAGIDRHAAPSDPIRVSQRARPDLVTIRHRPNQPYRIALSTIPFLRQAAGHSGILSIVMRTMASPSRPSNTPGRLVSNVVTILPVATTIPGASARP